MDGIAKQLALRLAGPAAASLTCQDLASICWAFGRPRVRSQGGLSDTSCNVGVCFDAMGEKKWGVQLLTWPRPGAVLQRREHSDLVLMAARAFTARAWEADGQDLVDAARGLASHRAPCLHYGCRSLEVRV